MPEIGQDEARRARIAEVVESVIALAENERLAEAVVRGGLDDWRFVLAALRAPSLDRGAEEMRALPTSDFRQGRKVPRNVYHGDEPLFMAATDDLASELVQVLNAGAAAIRALPVPADLNEGEGK